MTKQEIKEAMIDLVDETITSAIYDDCEVNNKAQFEYAIKILINELKKQEFVVE